jgi:hypothetical protein
MSEIVKEIRDDVKLLLADKHARDGADAVKKTEREYKKTLFSVFFGVSGAFVFEVIKGWLSK